MRKFAEGTEALAAGGVAATALLAAFPIVSPLVQIWLLAQKPKEEIEDIVRMKEPLQVLLSSFGQIPFNIIIIVVLILIIITHSFQP